jgi:hypothetical protein
LECDSLLLHIFNEEKEEKRAIVVEASLLSACLTHGPAAIVPAVFNFNLIFDLVSTRV